MDTYARDNTAGGRSVNQLVATGLGAVYLLVGIVGFFVSSGHGFADQEGGHLLGVFEVNPLHNVVHVAIGLALLFAATRLGTARAMNTIVGGTYLAVGVVGLFAPGEEWNILAINGADNVLHLGSAAVLLGVGLFADRDRSATAYATTDETATTMSGRGGAGRV